MTFPEFVIDLKINFNKEIKSEEDLKIKVLLPYLESLGYSTMDMRFENSIPVQIGTKKSIVKSDIEIIIESQTQIVIDVKKPTVSLNLKEILQSSSYAKLVSTPPAIYAVATNGIDCIVTNILNGSTSNAIPSKHQLIRDIDKSRRRRLTDIEIREIKSVLLTLLNQDDLYKMINKCKEIIEKRGLIRSDQSFREMTKIILVKMNEERRVKVLNSPNRFTTEFIESSAKLNSVLEIEVFKELFQEAQTEYPDIYNKTDENLQLKDNECIKEVVKNLEYWSFLGTGDDIKGAVYEIFLKSTLRGDFDQYFTPREIVEYIISFADPNLDQVILDPACGSGGFLIQTFKYINQKLINLHLSEKDKVNKFRILVDSCLWGNEADYDLHVLAKINLIMHGDGYNHITYGDTLKKNDFEKDKIDFIFTNPPFTIKYEFPDTLSNYELGLGKESEELDILFVEKCISILKPEGELYIVLPEGLLNNRKYKYFRNWLLKKVNIVCVISLPEGSFIPFGKSVSKTCILGVRKKGLIIEEQTRPGYVFLGKALEIGYETGKANYRPKKENDLLEFLKFSKTHFSDIKTSSNGAECGWVNQFNINPDRIDASYLLNTIDRIKLKRTFSNLIPLDFICSINNKSVKAELDKYYYYLEVPDISPISGIVTNIRYILGAHINSDMHSFSNGDLLFTRINPRISRVTITPEDIDYGLVSKEVYIIKLKPNEYILDKYVLCSILQSEHVKNQVVRLSTGSSSSRARVHLEDFLKDVYIPIPGKEIQEQISKKLSKCYNSLWKESQEYLKTFVSTQKDLGTCIDKNTLRSI
ncbi:MAG: N-6 DNA methylase [Ignavibacteriaceae bacterium]